MSTPPQSPYGSSPYPEPAADALVLPASAGFRDWSTLVLSLLRRSWRSLLIILGLGVCAPYALLSMLDSGIGVSSLNMGARGGRLDNLPDVSVLIGALSITLILGVAASLIAAAGWAAATWALTQEAATGAPAGIGAAFGYGTRRALSLWLWSLLAGLIILVGLCACVLPGLYLAFATSLFPLVVLFEPGQNPIARSFRLVHSLFAPTLGKLAALAGVVLVYEFALGCLIEVPAAVARTTAAGSVAGDVAAVFAAGVRSLLLLPVYALALACLITVYAQLRSREVGLSAAQLRHELG